ncbi:flagellar motor switch protein FliM [Pseudolysinimonas sp.]|uniref:flagellar motor switch protein FliM n=1 Tax=Pseudolysinimonas sp. TaxID=2680009 RepID=UPI003F8090F5
MTVQVMPGVAARPDAEVYDFRSPATLARDQARALDLAFETFARQWGIQFTAKLRTVCRIATTGTAISAYDDYTARMPAGAALALIPMGPAGARAVFQLSAADMLGWVGRMLGGAGVLPPPERPFTTIELAMIRKLLDETLEELGYSFGAFLPRDLAVEAVHASAQLAQAAAPADLMVVASFHLRIGEAETAATLAIPASVLLPALGSVEEPAGPSENAERLRGQLAAAPVGVAARFAPLTVNPGVVLDLAVGDVLRLPHPASRPLDVAVDGIAVATAAIGSTGSRLACVVVDTEES